VAAPEARVALANLDTIARGRVLLVGFGDPTLAEEARAVADEVTVLEQELYNVYGDAVFAPWLTAGEFDSIVLRLPKAAERARMTLSMAGALCAPAAHVTLIGRNDAGGRSAGRFIRDVLHNDPETLDYRFHCRALTTIVTKREPFDPAAWRTSVQAGDLTLIGYPGVFAHERLDPATAMLLPLLPPAKRALDVGCGSGGIATSLARAGAAVIAVDTDALALEATRETLVANGASAEVRASDVYRSVPEIDFDLIASNPPFHAGVHTTSEVARRLITEAPTHLVRGELWIVANKFLDYAPVLNETFARATIEAEDTRYRVWRARHA